MIRRQWACDSDWHKKGSPKDFLICPPGDQAGEEGPPFSQGIPGGTSGKARSCQCRRRMFHPWLGVCPGVENGNPLQYSCLENPMDRGAGRATVHGVSESDMTEATQQQ